MSTASGKYKFSDKYYDRKLSDWVHMIYKKICIVNCWDIVTIGPGLYVYDYYATVIAKVLDNLEIQDNKFNLHECASLVHDGWCENYLFWYYTIPYCTLDKAIYNAAFINENINIKAFMSYDLLSKDDQINHIKIAKTILAMFIRDITPNNMDFKLMCEQMITA